MIAVSEQNINDKNLENIKTMLCLGGRRLKEVERSSGAQIYLFNEESRDADYIS